MKNFTDKIIILFLLTLVLTSCDDYDRTEVVPTIFVDHPSLDLFVGDEIQLGVNPKDGSSYTWESTTENVATVSNGLVKAVGEGTADIYVRKGDIYTIVPVTVAVKIPLTGIELSTDKLELFPNNQVQVLVTDIPENANDVPRTDFLWWTDNQDVAIPTSNGKITGVGEGITTVYYRKGTFIKSVIVDVATSRPFKGPHILSKENILTLEARNFDFGGKGYAYHDDAGNSGGSSYRADNGDNNSPDVDIEGGGNIGYANAGEWLLYTVEVHDAGTYLVQLQASGNGGDGYYHIEVDGEDQTGQLSVPANGSWSNWTWYPSTPGELTLTEGKHKIKLYIDKSGFNFYKLKFEFKN
ncbi:MAG: carbohydrate-binding protein [Prevotella sp.]|jgi:hypothetical protein|nr:carbohydrate-binding protein [Prevotella sp.]